MAVASIPGFNVQKIGKNRYAVSVNNGNMGARVVNKSELKMLADMYDGKVNDGSTAKKILGGLAVAGALTAAVVYRKNIGNFIKGIKDGKIGEFAEGAKTKIATAAETVKNKTVAGAETVKDAVNNGAGKVRDTAGKWYNKVANWIVNVWKGIKNFFKGLFGKKPDAVQQELPFPKNEKAGEEIFSNIHSSAKKCWNNIKNFFKNLPKDDMEQEILWDYRLANQKPVDLPRVPREPDLLTKLHVAK